MNYIRLDMPDGRLIALRSSRMTPKLESLKRLNERINWVMIAVSASALTFMAFMTTVDVILRAFKNPFPASVEISQLIEPWVIFLPFAYTLAMDRHVKVGLLTLRLPRFWKLLSDLFALLVALGLFAALTWYSWLDFHQSWAINEIMMAAIILPWWAGKLAMPIGMALLTVQCVISAVFVVEEYKNPSAEQKIVLPAL